MLEAEILAAAWLTADRVPMALARSERWLNTPVPDDFGGKQLLVNLAHRSAIAAEPATVATDLLHRALAGNELLGVGVAGARLRRHGSGRGRPARPGRAGVRRRDRARPADRVAEPGRRRSCSRAPSPASAGAPSPTPRPTPAGRSTSSLRWGPTAPTPGRWVSWSARLVERGDLAGARTVLATCPDDPLPETMGWAIVIQARGRLHLAAGDPAAAVPDLRDAGARFERLACRGPGLAWWQTDLAIALARLGNLDDARDVAEEFAGLARATGIDRYLSVAARTLAAVSPPGGRERTCARRSPGPPTPRWTGRTGWSSWAPTCAGPGTAARPGIRCAWASTSPTAWAPRR
jgi:hypothetical protein